MSQTTDTRSRDGAPGVRTHPVLGLARALGPALDRVAGAEPMFLAEAEKEEALRLLHAAEQRLVGLRMRVMVTAGDVAEEHAARDVGAWLAHTVRADAAATHRDLDLGRRLQRRWTRLAEALGDGRATVAQVRVIADTLEELPKDLDPEILARAEEHLVSLCGEHDPRQLRLLGRRILEVVAPEIAEAEEGRRLEDEERRAREKTSLRFKRLGTGATRITLNVPDADADRLRTYLDAFTSPRRTRAGFRDGRCAASSTTGSTGTGSTGEGGGCPSDLDRIPVHRLRGQGFCALLEHLDPATLPDHGGDATHVMVTIGLGQLQEQLAAAGIGPEERISANQARRLACTAQIIPAVLGGRGEVLDLGRAQRLFTPAQRRAMALRDRRCRAEGCSIPAAWCESHHLQPWSHGGKTDLADGVLLCSWHHHRVHDQKYDHQRLPTGDFRFSRRT